MKERFKRKSVLPLIIVLLIVSCSKSDDKGHLQILKVYENIDKPMDSYPFDRIAGNKEILPLETTGNSFISDVDIKFITRQYICLSDHNTLLFFDHSGKYQFKLNSRGDGPAEYHSLSDVFYNPNGPTFYIHDMYKKKLLEFQNS